MTEQQSPGRRSNSVWVLYHNCSVSVSLIRAFASEPGVTNLPDQEPLKPPITQNFPSPKLQDEAASDTFWGIPRCQTRNLPSAPRSAMVRSHRCPDKHSRGGIKTFPPFPGGVRTRAARPGCDPGTERCARPRAPSIGTVYRRCQLPARTNPAAHHYSALITTIEESQAVI